MNQKWIDWLTELNACGSAREWLAEQKNPKQAWADCERGDWMLWLLGKLSGEAGNEKRKKLVLTACACARLSLRYVKKGEKRPLIAIQIAEKWARGKATIEEVRKAAAADAAAYAAADAAAYAADAAAYAAYAAAYAAYAAAADAAADDAALNKMLKKCANIVRKFYPNPPIERTKK